VVVGARAGAQPADAAGVERHDVRAEPGRRRSDARRRQRRPALGVPGEAGERRRAAHLADAQPRVYDDKVYIATADARLIALNARTGAVAWDHQVADTKLGYTYSSGTDRGERG
jgi:outer membrane protein assembly factor BamB